MHRVIVGVMVLAVGAACSSADDGTEVRAAASGEPSPEGVEATIYRGTLAVLEDPAHGPQLCSVMADSYPPQCGGPDVVGWSWDDVEGEESANGTTWGSYEVVGTWDGERLTLTEPPAAPRAQDAPEPDFSTPCPEPEGGWAVVDPATTTRSTVDAAVERARRLEGFAGVWIDSSEAPLDEPTKIVLNVRVTGDVTAAEADLRTVWGGALCVSSAERTLAELHTIQDEIFDDETLSGLVVSGGVDETRGVLGIDAFVDDGLQAELDDRYGAGVVEITALLQPVG